MRDSCIPAFLPAGSRTGTHADTRTTHFIQALKGVRKHVKPHFPLRLWIMLFIILESMLTNFYIGDLYANGLA